MATYTPYAATYHNDAAYTGAAQGRTACPAHSIGERLKMLWTIIVILFILWLLGFSLHVGGGLIHIILVIAVIVLVYNLITGRRGI